MRLLHLILAASLVVACSPSNERGVVAEIDTSTEIRTGAADDGKGVLITKDEYGASWPYTLTSGRLYCDPPGSNVVLESGGKVYALNGRAMGNAEERGYLIARETITLRDDYGYFTVGDTSAIISRGLEMCE